MDWPGPEPGEVRPMPELADVTAGINIPPAEVAPVPSTSTDWTLWIAYLTHLRSAVQLQQEVRDRWFQFYLLMTAGTLTFVTAVLTLVTAKTRAAQAGALAVCAMALGLASVFGFLFFLLYGRQRVNYTRIYQRIGELERALEGYLGLAGSNLVRQRYGADFIAMTIQSIVTAVYLSVATGIGTYLLSQGSYALTGWLSSAAAVIAGGGMQLIRWRYFK